MDNCYSNCILLLNSFIVYHYYIPSSLHSNSMLHFIHILFINAIHDHFIILLMLFIQTSPPVTSFTVTITFKCMSASLLLIP